MEKEKEFYLLESKKYFDEIETFKQTLNQIKNEKKRLEAIVLRSKQQVLYWIKK